MSTSTINTIGFLKSLWGDLNGYYVVGIHRKDGSWEWHTVDVKTDPEFIELLVEERKNDGDIYYSVNPRYRDPNGGKGSDADVKEANVFFADLDFKVPGDNNCEVGIQKYDPSTHELIACYEENGKKVRIHRPPLKEVLKKLEEADLLPVLFIVDSGNGYQILWKNSYTLDAGKWKQIEEEIIEKLVKVGLPVDKNVKDISRVLRLPGSINHRNGRQAKVIYIGDYTTLLPKEYRDIVEAVFPCFKKADHRRFELVGHLSGFLVRRGISLEDIEMIVEVLYNKAGISRPEHVKDIKYTYKDFLNNQKVTGFPKLKALCDELGAPVNPVLLKVESKKKKKKKGKEEKEQEAQQTFVEEKPIQSFDVLRIYHDFQHEKAYVSTWKAVIRYVPNEDGEREPRKVVTIDKVYVNEKGNIHVLTEEEYKKLEEEYFSIRYLNLDIEESPNDYQELNLPTEIKTDVKIAEVYKKLLDFIKQRVTLKYEEDYIAVTVWVIGTYFYRMFLAYPYLAPLKMGYNSGGTELLWTLKKVLPRPELFNDPSPASIYTTVEKKDVCQLFDEFRDNISKDRIEEIKNILRAGYRKGGIIQRVKIVKGGEWVPVKFDAYSPKAIIDQSLVTSEYDIASRCLFVWLIRDPNRKSVVSDERPKDLVNELYSVFLRYAPQVYTLYNNIETGLTGRYDQLFRALISIAKTIDAEDGTLKVTEQLYKALERSIGFSESIALEGDPQKKIVSLVISYIKESIGEFFEGLVQVKPEAWHYLNENKESKTVSRDGLFYIFISNLRKEITKRAVEVYQRDISYRLVDNKTDEEEEDDQEQKKKKGQKLAMAEREWERLDPEIAEYLKERKFVAILKRFFPENVRIHRGKNAFFLTYNDYNKIISLNFHQPPSGAGSRGEGGGGDNLQSGGSYLSQSDVKNTNSLKTPTPFFPTGSESGSVKNIQNTSTEKENSKSLGEFPFNSSLRSTENITEPGLTFPAQFRLNPGSEIIIESRDYFKEGGVKNSTAQAKSSLIQKIQDLLKKILNNGNGSMPLKDLEPGEQKLLTALKERGLINIDNGSVRITNDGYLYLDGVSVELTIDKIIEKAGYKFTVEELRKAIIDVTNCPTPDCVDDWIKTLRRVMLGRFRRTVTDFIKNGYQGELVKRRT